MKSITLKAPVLGVIYGNIDFFPDQLFTEARADIAQVFARLGIKAISLPHLVATHNGFTCHVTLHRTSV
jgi:hypothetical protein